MVKKRVKKQQIVMFTCLACLIIGAIIATKIGKEEKWEDTAVRISLENTVKKINSIEEIADNKAKGDVMSAVRKGGDIVYTDSGVDYIVITVDNTDKNIVAKEIKDNKARNTLTLYWALEDRENNAEAGKETAVFEIRNEDRKAVAVEPLPAINTDEIQTFNVVAIGNGKNTKFVDAKTNKHLDTNIVTWYGNGVYNVVMEGSDIKESARAKVIEIEGKVVELENREGKITIDIGDSTKIEAVNLGQPVLKEMIYNFQMYYTDKGFEVYPVEQMIKARVKG